MSKYSCEMIKDLLPLYTDDVCSDESRKTVEEHLAECPACRAELEKLAKGITVAPEKDANVMKRIKKRLRTEKIAVAVISLAAILFAAVGSLILLINMTCAMDYEKYNMAENMWAEEDENGDVWLVRQNAPATADVILPTISDTNGNHLGTKQPFDPSKKNGSGFTLLHRMIDELAFSDFETEESRTLMFNTGEREEFEKLFYYDEKTNTEYILWERD